MLLTRLDCSVSSSGALASVVKFYGDPPRIRHPWNLSRLEVFCRGDTAIVPDSADVSQVKVEVFIGLNRIFSRLYIFDRTLAAFNIKPVIDTEDLREEPMHSTEQLRVELSSFVRTGQPAPAKLETIVQLFGNIGAE